METLQGAGEKTTGLGWSDDALAALMARPKVGGSAVGGPGPQDPLERQQAEEAKTERQKSAQEFYQDSGEPPPRMSRPIQLTEGQAVPFRRCVETFRATHGADMSEGAVLELISAEWLAGSGLV
jgi:hypothetical protein